MRYPKTHAFLKWSAPALTGTLLAVLAVFTGLAQTYPKVSKWGEDIFSDWWPAMTAPWFIGIGIFLVLIYVLALVYTGKQTQLGADTANLSYRTERARQKAITDAEDERRIKQARLDMVYRRGTALNPAPPFATQMQPTLTPSLKLKGQVRNLLSTIDDRLLSEIDRHNLEIETRMSEMQFQRLNELVGITGSEQFISKTDITGRFEHSVINDGTFGPTTAEPLQIRVKFKFTENLRA